MDIEKFAENIALAARSSFTEFRERIGSDEIIGYAILSHDTADSCAPVVATYTGLADFTYANKDDFRFSPVEWDEFDKGASFDLVNEEIGKLYNAGDYEADPDWHVKFREFVFEANVKALEILIDCGFFGTEHERDKIFVIFSLSDSETFKTHEPEWVKRLNTTKVSNRNIAWRASYA